MPAAQAQNGTVISLAVDGARQGFATDAKTVAEVLARAEVRLAQDDLVEPALNTLITTKVFYINVYRAKPAVVIDGAREVLVKTPYQNPKLIAERSAGLTVYAEDGYKTDLIRDFVDSGILGHRIEIERSVPITVSVDGQTLELRSRAPTVGAMLSEKGLVVGNDDIISADRNSPLSSGMQITVTRVGKEVVAVEEAISAPIQNIFDNNKPPGYEEIRQAGAPGKQLVTYQVNFHNGTEVSRQPLQTVVIKEPIKRIVIRGVSFAGDVWLQLRLCESGGDYTKNTGNGYYGAYQFSPGTWDSMGTGYGYAHEAPPEVQDSAAQRLQARSGWGQWPSCARKMGLY